MPAAEGGFDDHPVSLLHLVPNRGLGPDLLDPPDDLMPQDQRVLDREGGGFPLEHPRIGSADSGHLHFQQTVIVPDLREGKLPHRHLPGCFHNHGPSLFRHLSSLLRIPLFLRPLPAIKGITQDNRKAGKLE